MNKPVTIFSRQIIYAVVASMFFLSLLAFGVVASAQSSERIELFKTDIVVAKDGSFKVTEHITYTFPEDRHGIYRCIPLIHAEKPSSILRERYIDISLGTIEMDGERTPYTQDRKNGEICIKVGDPETTITGTHEYIIQYTVAGAISYTTYGGAELYWNVTGNDWEVPMSVVQVSVASPDGLLLPERACYQGIVGEIGSCTIKTTDDGVVLFSGTQFDPYEGLTIAQALNRSNIPYDVRERYNSFLLWGGIVVFFGLIGGMSIYRYKTTFKEDAPIVPQYEPYPGVRPMYAGYLFDKRLDPRDITAGILHLAQKGFIRIRRTEEKVLFIFEVDDYEMTLLRPLTETEDMFELLLLQLIFQERAIPNSTVTLNDLKSNYGVVQNNRKLLMSITKGLRLDMKESGLYMGFSTSSSIGKIWTIALIGFCVVGYFISIPVFIASVVCSLFIFIMLIDGRRTKKGYEALNHLKGFKDFLSVTESERYIFHNAPERNAEQFMEYLPYAIAFGVEKRWAKAFEGITIPNPGWYNGGVHAQTFNAVSLAQSLGGFSTAFASSSGASASSGGGHAGGGSGGGGGGSW